MVDDLDLLLQKRRRIKSLIINHNDMINPNIPMNNPVKEMSIRNELKRLKQMYEECLYDIRHQYNLMPAHDRHHRFNYWLMIEINALPSKQNKITLHTIPKLPKLPEL